MGYCRGVSRALELAHKAVETAKTDGKPVYSLGKLIHNSSVCASFAEQGLVEISSAQSQEPGVVVLRAHGIADALRLEFEEAGYQLVDATCPVVKHNLERIAEYSKTHEILIAGHRGHPETVAMQGVFVEGKPIKTLLVSSKAALPEPVAGKSYAVFVQTTFDQGLWNVLQSALQQWKQRHIIVEFVNNVCPSSLARRDAVLALCKECDAVLVIGGMHSANTKALAQLAREQGKTTWHIEDEKQITPEMKSCAILGVTAGASTPPTLIHQVIERLQQE